MELYESMNEKIADIIAIDGTPSSLYASAYIKDLRAENARLKSEVKIAKQQAVKEFADKLKEEIGDEAAYYDKFLGTYIGVNDKINMVIEELYGGEGQ